MADDLRPGQHCDRCGHACRHVAGYGLQECPNCGIPKPAPGEPDWTYDPQGKLVSEPRFVVYDGNRGCEPCGLPGRPLPERGGTGG